MPTFEPGDLIKVPFPYTDRPVRQRRPAFVVAAGELAEQHGLLWVLMVTSAENRRWGSDIILADYEAAGLPAPSMIRTAKIATIEASDAEPLGKAPAALTDAALEAVHLRIGASA